MKKNNNFFIRLGSVMLGMILAVIIAELIVSKITLTRFDLPEIPPPSHDSLLRLLPEDILGFDLKPGGTNEYASLSSLGTRNPEEYLNLKYEHILVMGDSTTFGMGLHDGEDWPSKLDTIIHKKEKKEFSDTKVNKESADVRVINLGVPGYNLYQSVERFKRYLDDFNIRLAILAFYSNDFEDTEIVINRSGRIISLERGEMPGFIPWTPLSLWLLNHSKLYRILTVIQSRVTTRKDSESESLNETRDAIRLFYKICNNRKISGLMLTLPDLHNGVKISSFGIPEEIKPSTSNKTALEIAKQEGLSSFDLTASFKGVLRKNVVLNDDPFHFNEQGNEIIAESVLKILNKENLF